MCLYILKLLGAKNIDCNPMYIILKYYIKDNCFMNFKLMEMDSSSYFEDSPVRILRIFQAMLVWPKKLRSLLSFHIMLSTG